MTCDIYTVELSALIARRVRFLMPRAISAVRVYVYTWVPRSRTRWRIKAFYESLQFCDCHRVIIVNELSIGFFLSPRGLYERELRARRVSYHVSVSSTSRSLWIRRRKNTHTRAIFSRFIRSERERWIHDSDHVEENSYMAIRNFSIWMGTSLQVVYIRTYFECDLDNFFFLSKVDSVMLLSTPARIFRFQPKGSECIIYENSRFNYLLASVIVSRVKNKLLNFFSFQYNTPYRNLGINMMNSGDSKWKITFSSIVYISQIWQWMRKTKYLQSTRVNWFQGSLNSAINVSFLFRAWRFSETVKSRQISTG